MTEFPEYTYSPKFVSARVALAWEASRTGFDTSSDLVWMHKHGCGSQRRLRICLIALNAWSLSSLLRFSVTQIWSRELPTLEESRGVFVHIENTSVTLHNQTSSNWKAIKTIMFLPFSSRHHQWPLSADRRRPLRAFPPFLAALFSFISTFNCSNWEGIPPLTKAADWMLAEVQVGSSTNLWNGNETLEHLLECEGWNLPLRLKSRLKATHINSTSQCGRSPKRARKNDLAL